MAQQYFSGILSFKTFIRSISEPAKAFVKKLDDNFTELYGSVGGNSPTFKQEMELLQSWKTDSGLYQEFVETNDLITQVNYWATSAKLVKLFTKDITYVNENPTVVVITDEVTNKILTTTIAYSGDEIINVTKVIS